jgi:methionyl-tRNA formyltransferase
MLKTVFFGTPDFVSPIVSLLKNTTELQAVVTTTDQPSGRDHTITPPPVKTVALELNISPEHILQFEKLDEKTVEKLKAYTPDLFVVAAYGKIIPQTILDIPRLGAINIHPSLLPKFRGASPIQSAILAGEEKTGVSIIKMDHLMDHGPIIAQSHPVTLEKDITLKKLHHVLFAIATQMLEDLLPDIQKHITSAIPQDETQATFCKTVKKEDGSSGSSQQDNRGSPHPHGHPQIFYHGRIS